MTGPVLCYDISVSPRPENSSRETLVKFASDASISDDQRSTILSNAEAVQAYLAGAMTTELSSRIAGWSRDKSIWAHGVLNQTYKGHSFVTEDAGDSRYSQSQIEQLSTMLFDAAVTVDGLVPNEFAFENIWDQKKRQKARVPFPIQFTLTPHDSDSEQPKLCYEFLPSERYFSLRNKLKMLQQAIWQHAEPFGRNSSFFGTPTREQMEVVLNDRLNTLPARQLELALGKVCQPAEIDALAVEVLAKMGKGETTFLEGLGESGRSVRFDASTKPWKTSGSRQAYPKLL